MPRIPLIFTILALLIFNSSCQHTASHHHDDDEEEATAHNTHHHDDDDMDDEASHHHSPDAIILTHEQAEAAGITVETAQLGAFHGVIQAGGQITGASCGESTLVATASGVVSLLTHVSEGMTIQQGTPVFTISSANLQDGDQIERARIAYQAAKREYERSQHLLNDKLLSEKDFTVVKANYETAKLAYEALGGGRNGSRITISATIGGFVQRCMVKDGNYVQVGTPLMSISKNEHLYLRAEVPERYYSQLSMIATARFKTTYSDRLYDLSNMHGSLLSFGRTAAGNSPYIPITFEFENQQGIVPGAFAEVWLITSERNEVLTLPLSAITEEQGVYFAYTQTDDHSYKRKEVELGANDGERVEVLSGIKPGERVVTTGAIHVKLASASKSIPGHTHNH